MKWPAAVVLLATSPSAKGQQHTAPHTHSRRIRDDDPKQKNKFVLSKDKDDAKASSRDWYIRKWKQRKLNRLMKSKNEISGIDKPESIGVLSNDMESVTIDPQDEIILSVDVEIEDNRGAQSQDVVDRRLNALTREDFKDKCVASILSISGGTRNYTSNPSDSYVYCKDGRVNGLPGRRCFYKFTGRVCKDGSCNGFDACDYAIIPYVVGPSCTGFSSCYFAEIGSVDSSCKDDFSCVDAELSGVDLINSCTKEKSCRNTNGEGAFTELIDCCNEDEQCNGIAGLDIVNAGCPNAPSEMPSDSPSISQVPSDSPSISQEPSFEPSVESSVTPSTSPTSVAKSAKKKPKSMKKKKKKKRGKGKKGKNANPWGE